MQETENNSAQQKVSIHSFNTVALIGSGSYSKVALVKKKDNDKIYALKIIKKDMLASRRQKNNLMVERNILVQTKNQFIIKIEFAFQNDNKFYFVLEYCPGGDLYYLLQKKRRFQEEYVKFYIAQIVLALQHLHSMKVLYRDLKPENIMIDKDGYLKLGDFGLSRNQYEGDLIFSICGTPEYLAPEILEQSGYGYSVDIWTVGCLIYEMATGNPPFYVEDNRARLLEMIRNVDVEIPSYLSPCLQDLLQKMFKKEPRERLGHREGMKEVIQHPWFQNFDWDRLEKRELVAPFIPQLRNDVDLQNFDPEFTESQLTPFLFDNATQYSNFTNFDYNISQQSRVSQNTNYNKPL